MSNKPASTGEVGKLHTALHNFLSAVQSKSEQAMTAAKQDLINAVHAVHPDKPAQPPATPPIAK
jgi:hypothetical protein